MTKSGNKSVTKSGIISAMNLRNKVRDEPWRRVWDEVWLKIDAQLSHQANVEVRKQVVKELYDPLKKMGLGNIGNNIKSELL